MTWILGIAIAAFGIAIVVLLVAIIGMCVNWYREERG